MQLGLIAISGLSFWFLLGFPFANHNESYSWIVHLNELRLLDVLSQRLEPVATYRPLGQATAWLGYRLSGGSIYPVQLFNYLGAVVSWLMLLMAAGERRLFSLVALVVGGFFFSGYVYLFHLHGVFYSPLLLLLAIYLFLYQGGLSNRKLLAIFLVAVLCSFFHPFALIIFLAATLGLLIEKWKDMTKRQHIVTASLVLLAFGLIEALAQGRNLVLTSRNLVGLLTSYKMVEVNPFLSSMAFLLTMMTAASVSLPIRSKALLMAIVSLLALSSALAAVPVIVVWVSVCLFKLILLRKWSIAFLLISAFLFPVFGGTGSPTYTIVVLMASAFAVPLGWSALESRLHFVDSRFALPAASLVVIMACGLRCGLHIPVISELANPVLAEKEKTWQLENIIEWVMKSEYDQYGLLLSHPASNPRESDTAIRRTHRPPTYQQYLDAYMNSLRDRANNGQHRLLVCFGDQPIRTGEQVYEIKGKYAGSATVFLPSQ